MISRSIISLFPVDPKYHPHVLNVAAQEWAVDDLKHEAEKFGYVFLLDDGRFDFQIELHATYDAREFVGHMQWYANLLLSELGTAVL
jgi:hypothetical protein